MTTASRPEPPAADAAADAATAPADCANCANCAAVLATGGAPRPRFCPCCGQETTLRAPTLGEFVQQFGGAYLSTEGALWRSLKLLLLRPGELTAQYLAGRRKHYVLPLRLYLTISLVVLLLVRLAGSGSVEIKVGDPAQIARENSNLSLAIGGGRAGMRAGVFYCEDLPGWVCQRLKRRIDIAPDKVLGEVESIRDRFLGNLGGAMFVLLPAFALGLKLAYLNRRLRYTEHLVFALHVHAFWFLALLLSLSDWGPVKALAVLAVPVYTLWAMRRVYGGRWWPRLLRAGLVSMLYGGALVLALAGVGLLAVLA